MDMTLIAGRKSQLLLFILVELKTFCEWKTKPGGAARSFCQRYSLPSRFTGFRPFAAENGETFLFVSAWIWGCGGGVEGEVLRLGGGWEGGGVVARGKLSSLWRWDRRRPQRGEGRLRSYFRCRRITATLFFFFSGPITFLFVRLFQSSSGRTIRTYSRGRDWRRRWACQRREYRWDFGYCVVLQWAAFRKWQ